MNVTAAIFIACAASCLASLVATALYVRRFVKQSEFNHRTNSKTLHELNYWRLKTHADAHLQRRLWFREWDKRNNHDEGEEGKRGK